MTKTQYQIEDQNGEIWLRLKNLDDLSYSEWFTYQDIITLKQSLSNKKHYLIQGKLLRLQEVV